VKKASWWIGFGFLVVLAGAPGRAAAADTPAGGTWAPAETWDPSDTWEPAAACSAVSEDEPAAQESPKAVGDKWEEGIAYHKAGGDCTGCAQLQKEWPVIVDGCGTTQCTQAKTSAVTQFKKICKQRNLNKCDCDKCILAKSTCNHGPGC